MGKRRKMLVHAANILSENYNRPDDISEEKKKKSILNKVHMEFQGTLNSQNKLEKKNQTGGPTLSDSKITNYS